MGSPSGVVLDQFVSRPEPQQVAVDPKSTDLTLGDFSENRVAPEFIPGMDIGHMHFDDGRLEDTKGVQDSIAVMGPGTGVDDNRIDLFIMGTVDALHHFTFMIGLETFNVTADF